MKAGEDGVFGVDILESLLWFDRSEPHWLDRKPSHTDPHVPDLEN